MESALVAEEDDNVVEEPRPLSSDSAAHKKGGKSSSSHRAMAPKRKRSETPARGSRKTGRGGKGRKEEDRERWRI